MRNESPSRRREGCCGGGSLTRGVDSGGGNGRGHGCCSQRGLVRGGGCGGMVALSAGAGPPRRRSFGRAFGVYHAIGRRRRWRPAVTLHR